MTEPTFKSGDRVRIKDDALEDCATVDQDCYRGQFGWLAYSEEFYDEIMWRVKLNNGGFYYTYPHEIELVTDASR